MERSNPQVAPLHATPSSLKRAAQRREVKAKGFPRWNAAMFPEIYENRRRASVAIRFLEALGHVPVVDWVVARL
jgi:hypothetical protein